MPLPKYVVRLTVAERTQLEALIRTGQRTASTLIHARILLKTDRGRRDPVGTMSVSQMPWSAENPRCIACARRLWSGD